MALPNPHEIWTPPKPHKKAMALSDVRISLYKWQLQYGRWVSFGSFSFKKHSERSPRRVAISTPRPQGRWISYAWRRALPVCGSDNPRRTKLYTLQALKMGRRARCDGLRGAVMSEVSGDAVRGFGQ